MSHNGLVPFRSKVPSLLDDVFDGLFQEFWKTPAFVFERNWRPTNIEAREKDYLIEVELPRVKKEHVKVEVVDGALVISVKNDKVSFVRSFSYSDADVENSSVTLEDGVLTVIVPRTTPETKTLEIKVK